MKRVVLGVIAAMIFFFSVCLRASAEEAYPLPDIPLPPTVSDELGQIPKDANDVVSWLDAAKLLSGFGQGVRESFLSGVRFFFLLASVSSVAAAMSALSQSVENKGVLTAFEYMTVLGGAVLSLSMLKTVFEGVVAHMETLSAFAVGVIPAYAGVCTAAGMNGLSLAAGGGLSFAGAFVALIAKEGLMPLLRICFIFGCSAAISGISGISQISALVRRFFVGAIGAVGAILTAVFAFQTNISAKADSLAGRAFRYVASSALPLVGNALSEASRTLSSAFSLMSGVTGGVGVAAVLLLMVPIATELWMLRLAFLLAGAVSDVLDLPKLSGLYRDAGALLGALLAILTLVDAVLILEFAMIMRVG